MDGSDRSSVVGGGGGGYVGFGALHPKRKSEGALAQWHILLGGSFSFKSYYSYEDEFV